MSHTIKLPPDCPRSMRQLPKDSVGRPIPFFAAVVDGEHDFRLMDPEKLVRCVKEKLCWVCGEELKRQRTTRVPYGTFVVGPMCVVNRISSEPPSHTDCAEWSAKACPFLTMPKKVRRESDLPENLAEPAGTMITRNPGIVALVESPTWYAMRDGDKGLLFRFNITSVRWMAYGNSVVATDVLHSIDTGLPALAEKCGSDPACQTELGAQLQKALRWVAHESIEDYPIIAATLRHAP